MKSSGRGAGAADADRDRPWRQRPRRRRQPGDVPTTAHYLPPLTDATVDDEDYYTLLHTLRSQTETHRQLQRSHGGVAKELTVLQHQELQRMLTHTRALTDTEQDKLRVVHRTQRDRDALRLTELLPAGSRPRKAPTGSGQPHVEAQRALERHYQSISSTLLPREPEPNDGPTAEPEQVEDDGPTPTPVHRTERISAFWGATPMLNDADEANGEEKGGDPAKMSEDVTEAPGPPPKRVVGAFWGPTTRGDELKRVEEERRRLEDESVIVTKTDSMLASLDQFREGLGL